MAERIHLEALGEGAHRLGATLRIQLLESEGLGERQARLGSHLGELGSGARE